MIPTAAPTIDCIGKALENLALAALNDTTILQQLTVANLALAALVTLLTAAKKKLADALVQNIGARRQRQHRLRERVACQTSLSRGTIAGPMVIRSIRTTRVQPADTRPQDTRTMQQAQIQWEVAKRTRDGTPMPDGVGVPI